VLIVTLELPLIQTANVGDSMLQQKAPSQDDVNSVGAVIVELLEPKTSLEAPGTTELVTPDQHSQSVQDFVQMVQSADARSLLQVSGLPGIAV
jgi:hypothetical protein